MLLLSLLLACTGEPAPTEPMPVEPEPVTKRFDTGPVRVHVDRAGHELTVREADGTVSRTAIGIGRGGLVEKTAMSDYVTPTGTFAVDLVLHEAGTHNAVDHRAQVGAMVDAEYTELTGSEQGLAQLFANMSELDFDGDGAPDRAYGSAYIGLHSDSAVTGPKLSRYKGTARWFSIALHGTPTPEEDLGASNSGGCVHLPADLLAHLIEDEVITLGQVVTIADGPPAWQDAD